MALPPPHCRAGAGAHRGVDEFAHAFEGEAEGLELSARVGRIGVTRVGVGFTCREGALGEAEASE